MTSPRLRATENLHILLWLIKDTCWVQDYRLVGVSMIIPTISVAVLLTVRTRKVREEFIHNLAVVFWLCANSIWMIGEFYYNDSTRPFSVVFFALGLVTLAVHYIPKWTVKKVKNRQLSK
ncbi:hypothetical protein BH11BAC1_BH11BAC1_11570 [soil metagenome]